MRRIARWACAAVAALAGVSSTAQVLTVPLATSPTVRLTDSCSTEENAGVLVGAPPSTVSRIAAAVNLPGGDPAVLCSLWWPSHAGGNFDISGEEFIVITYASPFQDTRQIAADILANWASKGRRAGRGEASPSARWRER